MNHNEFDSLLPAYVLGALEPEENAQMEAHLRLGCETCEGRLRGYRMVTAALPLSAGEREVRPELKAALMARIARPATKRRWNWVDMLPVLAGGLAACAFLVWFRGAQALSTQQGELVLRSGSVTQKSGSKAVGSQLDWDTSLEANEDSEIQVGASAMMLLRSGSELRLTHAGEGILADLPEGSVFLAVYHGTPFGVQAGRTRVDAHGTLFLVRHLDTNSAYVCICQGRIRVRAPGLDREMAAENYGKKFGLNLQLADAATQASDADAGYYTDEEAGRITNDLKDAAMAARRAAKIF